VVRAFDGFNSAWREHDVREERRRCGRVSYTDASGALSTFRSLDARGSPDGRTGAADPVRIGWAGA
jgi:hypothetical protein